MNILSQARLKSKYMVTNESTKTPAALVYLPEMMVRFDCTSEEIYIYINQTMIQKSTKHLHR
jgi:hypothetical protein